MRHAAQGAGLVVLLSRAAAAQGAIAQTELQALGRVQAELTDLDRSGRVMVQAADPSVRELSVIVTGLERSKLTVVSREAVRWRGDTLTMHVDPASPVAIYLPRSGFAVMLQAATGRPALFARLLPAGDPAASGRATAIGATISAARDSAGGVTRLGASSR